MMYAAITVTWTSLTRATNLVHADSETDPLWRWLPCTVAPMEIIDAEIFCRCSLWSCAHKMVPASQPYQVREPDEGCDLPRALCLISSYFMELMNTGSGMARSGPADSRYDLLQSYFCEFSPLSVAVGFFFGTMSILEGKGTSGAVERISEVSYAVIHVCSSCIVHVVSRTTSQR